MSGVDTSPQNLALFTDLYELTMLQSYHDQGMEKEAVFSLFVRKLPPERNFFLAAGLEDALDYLENLRFDAEDIAYLHSLNLFSPGFLDWLASFRFEGDVYAVREGTPVFANEPILEIVAPIGQAQLVETAIMNQVHLQTVLASKAARVVAAAQGRTVVDFGARRIHGYDAAIKGARAFYIAGAASTSNVAAGRVYGIPVAGTMAHSYIEAFDREQDAFAAFMQSFPETVLLVDTYDTIEGVKKVIALAREMGEAFRVRAVRLDSGNLAALAKETRRLLDEAGLKRVGIFASGSLDEYEIERLLGNGAPIDGFGVGTSMGVSKDVPALDIAYKLVAYGGQGRLKLSPGKETYPGRKQIWRKEVNGVAQQDVLALADENLEGRPLLEQVMCGGKRTRPAPALEDIRAHAQQELGRLPGELRRITPARHPYLVTLSDALSAYTEQVIDELKLMPTPSQARRQA